MMLDGGNLEVILIIFLTVLYCAMGLGVLNMLTVIKGEVKIALVRLILWPVLLIVFAVFGDVNCD